MGMHAVRLLKDGVDNRIVAVKNNVIVDYDITVGLQMEKTMNADIMHMLKILSL